MQRPANSRIRHGNPLCRRYGCKRDECVEADRAYKRENDAARRQGVSARVPVAAVLEHMRLLHDAEMPTPDIGKVSGVDVKTLLRVLGGQRERIHWTTEEAILGVPIPDEGWESSADCYVDALPALRRLRALGVQGFTVPVISRESGVEKSVIGVVRSGSRSRVLMSTRKAVRRVHDRLYDADPSDFGVSPWDRSRALRWAEGQGWYPSEAWADIDNPDCEPVLGTPRHLALAEDARELISEHRHTPRMAADRLGVSLSQLGNALSHYNKAVNKARAS